MNPIILRENIALPLDKICKVVYCVPEVFLRRLYVNTKTRVFLEAFVEFLDISKTLPRTLKRDTIVVSLWLP